MIKPHKNDHFYAHGWRIVKKISENTTFNGCVDKIVYNINDRLESVSIVTEEKIKPNVKFELEYVGYGYFISSEFCSPPVRHPSFGYKPTGPCDTESCGK